MPDRLLHRTWSVRTCSPFVRTLRIGGPSPLSLAGDVGGGGGSGGGGIGGACGSAGAAHANTASASALASHESADANANSNSNNNAHQLECRWYPTLSELAEDMTNRLRACPDLVDSNTAASTAASGMLEIGGTYASLTWIDLDDEAALRSCGDGGSGGSRKRSRRSSSDGNGNGSSSSQKHLHIEVRINDEPAGQILLCSAEVAASAAAAAAPSGAETTSASAPSATAAAAAVHDPALLSPIAHSQYYSHSHEPIHVQSFSYLLLRGKKKALQPVLLYLESTLGCAIGTRPFTPSPADVAASLSHWMVGTVVQQRRQRRRLVAEQHQHRSRKSIGSSGSGGNGMDDDMLGFGGGGMGSIQSTSVAMTANKKPLELTLAIPPHLVRAGLERITVTVPPVSLTRLCSAVERKRPSLPSASSSTPTVGKGGSRSSGGAITPLMVTDSEKDDESSGGYRPGNNGSAVGTSAEAAAPASDDANGSPSGTDRHLKSSPDDNDHHRRTDSQVDHDEEDLPILRALQCYLYEAFRIDARQLHVVKAATAHAVVGTDGRIKPLTVEALPSLLDDIGMMIRRATGAARTESAGDEADES